MKNFSSLVILALSGSAFAGLDQSRPMTLATLKAKCVELSANEQIKPFKAVVACTQTSTEWRPSEIANDPVKIANVKQIGASFSLKGFSVPFQAEDVESPAAEVGCSNLEQFKLTVPAVDIELDCAALATVERIAELCGPAIEERLQADPSIQVTEATGMTFNSCTGQISGPALARTAN